MSACAAVRMFCLKCGTKSDACDRLKREGRCAKPKVYTADVASERAMLKMWKRSERDQKRTVEKKREKRARNACRNSSDVADGCFEDDWLD